MSDDGRRVSSSLAEGIGHTISKEIDIRAEAQCGVGRNGGLLRESRMVR